VLDGAVGHLLISDCLRPQDLAHELFIINFHELEYLPAGVEAFDGGRGQVEVSLDKRVEKTLELYLAAEYLVLHITNDEGTCWVLLI